MSGILPFFSESIDEPRTCLDEILKKEDSRDLTYIGEGKQLTLEQNMWLGHAVTTQTAALLLREVLGFDVSVIETAINWGGDEKDPLARLGGVGIRLAK